MKLLHPARHLAEAHLIRGFLESCGIPALIRGEALAGGIGELPLDVCSVWVSEDGHFDEACRLLRDFMQSRPTTGPDWQCTGCGETLEQQFTACWSCGTSRS